MRSEYEEELCSTSAGRHIVVGTEGQLKRPQASRHNEEHHVTAILQWKQ